MNDRAPGVGPKPTSYSYGEEHQRQMLEFYRQSQTASEDNPEYLRVRLVKRLIEQAHELQQPRPTQETLVLDIGCSIGTFAIEAAKMGFRSYGVDFDEHAIALARKLSAEQGTNPEFYRMDVSDWTREFPPVDIAVCADIFEHLHDDELGALLVALRKNLASGGLVVFHTLPQEYDYLFWRSATGTLALRWFMRPFKRLSERQFAKVVRITALLYDVSRILIKPGGTTFKESIKTSGHPNPLTKARLTDILHRCGYEIVCLDSQSWDAQLPKRDRAFFQAHSVTHRSLFGIARARPDCR